MPTVTLPPSVATCIDSLFAGYQSLLADNMRGFYVHGSIAMDCFNPVSSDIDVLVITEHSLSLAIKQQLGQLHLQLAKQCGKSIEISVVLQQYLDAFVYPTPFEFHYGDDHIEAFAAGTIDLETPRVDPDLAAHFVITKHYGLTLFGPPAQDAFPQVPDADYLDSIASDAEWCYNNIMQGPSTGDCDVPKYAVLNFCRVLAFIEEGIAISKREGGEWGLAHLPDALHPVIQAALDEYNITGSAKPIPCQSLHDFASYAFGKIKEKAP